MCWKCDVVAMVGVLLLFSFPADAIAQTRSGGWPETADARTDTHVRTGGGIVGRSATATLPSQDRDRSGIALTGHWAFRWTRLYEDQARLTGGGLGFIFARKNRIEAFGLGTASPSVYGSLEFHVAYGGLRVQRDLWTSKRLVTAVALSGGAGSFWTRERQSGTEDRTGMGVLEPEIVVGVAAGPHVRLAATGSYRWVTGIEGDILNRSDGDAADYAFGFRVEVR